MQDRINQVDETSCIARPDHTVGSFTSRWLLRSTVRMSASHPKATESPRSSEMTLSAQELTCDRHLTNIHKQERLQTSLSEPFPGSVAVQPKRDVTYNVGFQFTGMYR